MNWMQFVLTGSFLLVNIGGFGLTTWIVRKSLTDFKVDIAKISERQNGCRESLSERFADKGNTRDDMKELFARTDEQGRAIERMQGRMNGATA